MKKTILTVILSIVCLLFSSCGNQPSNQGENTDVFNRVISCHYYEDFNFEGLYEVSAYSAVSLADNLYLQTEYSGYVLDEYYSSAAVQPRISLPSEDKPSIIIFTYKKTGKSFEIRITENDPKCIAALSHNPTDFGTKSAVIYKYGEETFARYSFMEYTYEVSCTDVSDEYFLELLNIICPDGATADTKQTIGEFFISNHDSTYLYYTQSSTETLSDINTTCSEIGIPQKIGKFEISSVQIYGYSNDPTASDYVVEFAHKDGGTAIVKTSAIPGRLPKWWQIASGDDWSLFRLGRGYAMIFENRIETLARCYVNGRYYEINSEDIGAEEITELLTEICS